MRTPTSSLSLQALKTGKEEVAHDLLSVVQLQSQIAQSLATCLCLGALTPALCLPHLPAHPFVLSYERKEKV